MVSCTCRYVSTIAAILCLVIFLPVTSAPGVPHFDETSMLVTRMEERHGFKQSSITAITQDAQTGLLWFGTKDGLYRYDGHAFVVYKHDVFDANSLSDNFIASIFQDKSGDIWVGTNGGGLNKFDRANNRFIRYKGFVQDDAECGVIRTIVEDHQGILWLGTLGGLVRFDKATEQYTVYRQNIAESESSHNDNILSLQYDPEGYIWVGTEGGGLNKFEPKRGTFVHYDHKAVGLKDLGQKAISAIYKDKDGILWLATIGDGMYKFDPVSGQSTVYRHNETDQDSLIHDQVMCIYEDIAGDLWIGTNGGGISVLDKTTATFRHVRHDPAYADSLPDDYIATIYQDSFGVIWVGSLKGGVSKIIKTKFEYYNKREGHKINLSDQNVWTVAQDDNGFMWVGTREGIDKIDFSKKQVVMRYKHQPEQATSLGDNYVRAMAKDPGGGLWVGTRNGLDYFDPLTNVFTHYPKNTMKGPNANIIRALLVTHDGTLWLGTYGGGLNRFNRESGTFDYYARDVNHKDSISSNIVLSLYESRDGYIWVGTAGGGLNQFDRITGQFKHYSHSEQDPQSLSDVNVTAIYEDQLGTLWVGTWDGGLNKFNPATGKFEHYLEKDGLPSGMISGILEDDQGYLWISTSNGLSKFNPRTGVFRNYDAKDGLQGAEFNPGAHFKSNTGELFFGGTRGLNRFHPNKVSDCSHKPPILITSFKSSGKKIAVVQTGKGQEANLHYNDNNFTAEFVAIDYVAPEKSKFAYKLEGFDSEWIHAGDRRVVTYTNLDGGHYKLRIKATNHDGLWSEQEAAVDIFVATPPWETRLAYLLYLLFLGGAIGAYIKFRMQRQVRETRLLEKMVQERTDELRTTLQTLQDTQIELLQEKGARELADLLNQAYDYIFVRDRNDSILFVNKAAEQGYGWDIGDMLGKNIHQLLQTEFGMPLSQVQQTLLAQGFWEGEVIHTDGNGKKIVVHSRQSVKYAEDGLPEQILEISRDITEQREIAKEFQRLSRLNLVGEMAASIGHEIRNPLTVVKGFLQKMQRKEQAEKNLEYYAIILEELDRANAIITEYLALAKNKLSRLSDAYLNQIVNSLMPLLQAEAVEKGIELTTDLDDIPTVVVDVSEIRQLILNLFKNAVEAMRSGGRLAIRTYLDGSDVVLEVSDTGAGIPAEIMGRIGTPFLTTKDNGTGLGLAVCYSIAARHQAKMNFATGAEGTTVAIRFPLVRDSN